jgi:hypothetical protein
MSKQEKLADVKQKLAKIAMWRKPMNNQERLADVKQKLAKVVAWLKDKKYDTTKIAALQAKLATRKG